MSITTQAFKLYGISADPYTKFPRIKKKKNGAKKIRWIFAPEPNLKKVQQAILKNVLYRFAAHPCAHAYVAHQNIRSGAVLHTASQYMIVLDIKDFFPTITRDMVRYHLDFYRNSQNSKTPKDRACKLIAWDRISELAIKEASVSNELPPDVTILDLLLEFCTYEGCIPQGAPTSGAISNIVMYPLDCLFEQVAETHNFVYTRYADDLTFSGSDLEDLKKTVFGYVSKKLQEHGFTVNQSKVHVFQGDQKIVTGLNVHEDGVRPSRKYRRKFRARMANLRKKILEAQDVGKLITTLNECHYMRSELGHVWHNQYNDTYTEATGKMLSDYFIPIADHIAQFFPGFSTDPKFASDQKSVSVTPVFSTPLVGATPYAANHLIKGMHCEMKKMRMSSYDAQHMKLYKTPIKKALALTAITYHDRRNLIHQAIVDGTIEQDLRYCTIKAFNTIIRFASPEDKIKVLLASIRPEMGFTVYGLVCAYSTRFPYKQRLELLRKLASHKLGVSATGLEALRIGLLLRRMMKGLQPSDLTEFVTSNSEAARSAAQDLITYRQKMESDENKEVIPDPQDIPNQNQV